MVNPLKPEVTIVIFTITTSYRDFWLAVDEDELRCMDEKLKNITKY